MARRASTGRTSKGTQRAAAAAGAVARSNGIDPAVLKSLIARLDEQDAKLASAKGVYMKAAQKVAEDKKDLFTEAKSKGINPKALKTELKCRDYANKAAGLRASLEPEDAEQAELVRASLGGLAELPLGQAAVTAAEKRTSDANLADSLTGDDDDE
ncbi:MAG: DUF2312 domain-containing protein [Burkholderiales bacterium]|nr:DUF2312 domain-containing protein [Burkholderiales bacterium]